MRLYAIIKAGVDSTWYQSVSRSRLFEHIAIKILLSPEMLFIVNVDDILALNPASEVRERINTKYHEDRLTVF